MSAFFLRSFNITVNDAILVAGPTSKKTNIAPGENPTAKRAAASGVDEVAQIYNGKPTKTAPKYAPHPERSSSGMLSNESPMTIVMSPAKR